MIDTVFMLSSSFKYWFKEAGLGLLEFFWPIGCRGCSTIGKGYLCDSCLTNVVFIIDPMCKHCSAPLEDGLKTFCGRCSVDFGHHNGGISVALYDDPIGKLIRDLKYEREKGIAVFLANLVANRIDRGKTLYELRCDFVHPIPLSKSKQSKRGFNQAALIAHKIAEIYEMKYSDDLLIRIRDTESQTGLDFDKRMKNMAGAFEVNDKKAVEGKSFLLIDDVMTTGATIEECARILKNAGAGKVKFLTIARQMQDGDSVEEML